MSPRVGLRFPTPNTPMPCQRLAGAAGRPAAGVSATMDGCRPVPVTAPTASSSSRAVARRCTTRWQHEETSNRRGSPTLRRWPDYTQAVASGPGFDPGCCASTMAASPGKWASRRATMRIQLQQTGSTRPTRSPAHEKRGRSRLAKRDPTSCSARPQFHGWSPDRVSSSRTAANVSSRACRELGDCSQWPVKTPIAGTECHPALLIE